MDYLSEIRRNGSREYAMRLKLGYLTAYLGVAFMMLAVALGATAMLVHLSTAFAVVDVRAPSGSDASVVGRTCALAVTFVLACPIAWFVVASLFGSVMVRLGHFSPDDSRYFASRGRCPEKWFRE